MELTIPEPLHRVEQDRNPEAERFAHYRAFLEFLARRQNDLLSGEHDKIKGQNLDSELEASILEALDGRAKIILELFRRDFGLLESAYKGVGLEKQGYKLSFEVGSVSEKNGLLTIFVEKEDEREKLLSWHESDASLFIPEAINPRKALIHDKFMGACNTLRIISFVIKSEAKGKK